MKRQDQPDLDPDIARIRHVAAEWHADELVRVLRYAVVGKPGWRDEAYKLLCAIDAGQISL